MHHPTLSAWIDRLMAGALAGALALAVLTATTPSAQAAERVTGTGAAGAEQRTPAEFEVLNVTGSFQVTVRQGASAVTVRGDQNLLPLLETLVENGRGGKTLVVRWKRGSQVQTRIDPRVEVSTPRLTRVQSSGNSDVTVEGFTLTTLDGSVAGSGNLRLDKVQAQALNLSIAGSGDLAASGSTVALSLRIAGSGDAATEGLKADDVAVNIAGSGNAVVQAQRTLEVSIAGSGDVRYSGNAVVKSRIAGSGSVNKQ